MASQDDKNDLLDALFARHQKTGKRPSVWEAQMNYLPEWDKGRLFDTAQALFDDGLILNPTGAVVYVDLASTARKLASARTAPQIAPASTTNYYNNSNVQNVASGGSGTQNNYSQAINNDIAEIVRVYKENFASLNLDAATLRRANSQVQTLEAQLQDEPNPVIVNAAGKSLKTIVEGALAGAIGNAVANPGVWAGLLAFFS